MLNSKEIERAVAKLDEPPDSYNNIEIHLFFVLQDILVKFRQGRLSKEQATRLKKQAIQNYEVSKASYSTYQYYTDMIAKTEHLRIQLRKDKKLETALKLIELYSGEVGMWDLS